MNEEQLLQLQAWVDGELDPKDARKIEELLKADPDAEALAAELKMTKSFLAGNEPSVALNESREFYWSKIERQLAIPEPLPATTGFLAWLQTWRRFLAPVSGLALIAFLSVLSINYFQSKDNLQHLVEVENLDPHVGSISYKSQSENMFVVYLYNKDQESEGDDEFELMDDPVLQ